MRVSREADRKGSDGELDKAVMGGKRYKEKMGTG